MKSTASLIKRIDAHIRQTTDAKRKLFADAISEFDRYCTAHGVSQRSVCLELFGDPMLYSRIKQGATKNAKARWLTADRLRKVMATLNETRGRK